MKIFKKIGFVIIYYFLASIIDQIFMAFFGITFISFVFTAISICIMSCAFRSAQITNMNYLQEWRDNYKSSFKKKFKQIVSSLDFKVEIIMGTIVILLFTLIPRVALGACYFFFDLMMYNRFLMFVFIPLFVVVNFLIWYFAYERAFRKKKY